MDVFIRLQIALEYNKYFNKIVTMFIQIGAVLPQIRDYEQLFPNRKRLLYTISDAYLDILFCRKAKFVFRKNEKRHSWLPGRTAVLHVSWRTSEREFKDILADFQHHRDLVDREADVGQMWLVKSNMDLAERVRRGSDNENCNYKALITNIRANR